MPLGGNRLKWSLLRDRVPQVMLKGCSRETKAETERCHTARSLAHMWSMNEWPKLTRLCEWAPIQPVPAPSQTLLIRG